MHLEALNEEQKKIFKELRRFPKFYLAGGTALALQIGHRMSVDFDYFSDKELPPELLKQIESVFAGRKITPAVNNKDECTVLVDDIKLTLLHYPFPVLLPLETYNSLQLLSVPEIAATKAYTIGRRASYKDYIDLYFAVKGRYTTLHNIIALAEKKYGEQFHARLFLEQLTDLESVEEGGITFLKTSVTKKEIGTFFEKTIRNLKL